LYDRHTDSGFPGDGALEQKVQHAAHFVEVALIVLIRRIVRRRGTGQEHKQLPPCDSFVRVGRSVGYGDFHEAVLNTAIHSAHLNELQIGLPSNKPLHHGVTRLVNRNCSRVHRHDRRLRLLLESTLILSWPSMRLLHPDAPQQMTIPGDVTDARNAPATAHASLNAISVSTCHV
jgi:hypothetical protein